MQDPTIIIRAGSRIALDSFAEFLRQETAVVLPESHKRILAETLDHHFHALCRDEYEEISDKYLDYDD
jgi:urate oxidase